MDSRFFIPARGPDDWKRLLAKDYHWRTGYSAKALAHCWQTANSFPPEVKAVFDNARGSPFRDAKLWWPSRNTERLW